MEDVEFFSLAVEEVISPPRGGRGFGMVQNKYWERREGLKMDQPGQE